MKIIKNSCPPCVLTIGKFEGLHLGHRALIKEVVAQARGLRLPAAVMVFDPHPYAVLGGAGYKPLFTVEERAFVLAGLGVDYLLLQQFDTAFAALPAEAFCDKIFGDYGAQMVFVGEGYRFGRGRQGDVSTLSRLAEKNSRKLCVMPNIRASAGDISTSQIREHIAASQLPHANGLLGFNYFAMGETTPGNKLGREIGSATLNLTCASGKFLPPDGVYVTFTVIAGENFLGITNIGKRPTVNGKDRSIETHLLNPPEAVTQQEFYGQEIRLEFVKFLRPQKKFANLQELANQLEEDKKGAIL
ncbi:MAG: riboflavin biosynthesis protein RibF [Defluviitaleaceae bacterium]|nr:riboflavin biosynthesis protein RibF [Defluviitaleaceae bacterium]